MKLPEGVIKLSFLYSESQILALVEQEKMHVSRLKLRLFCHYLIELSNQTKIAIYGAIFPREQCMLYCPNSSLGQGFEQIFADF